MINTSPLINSKNKFTSNKENSGSLIVVGKHDQPKNRWVTKPNGNYTTHQNPADANSYAQFDPEFIDRETRKVGPGFWGTNCGISNSLELKKEIQKMNELENIIKTGLNNDSESNLHGIP